MLAILLILEIQTQIMAVTQVPIMAEIMIPYRNHHKNQRKHRVPIRIQVQHRILLMVITIHLALMVQIINLVREIQM